MSDEALTFSQLRKIQKTEARTEELQDIQENFFLRVGDYMSRKDETSREYQNAQRVINKIVSTRTEKIVKNAKLEVKSDISPSKKEMLPREKDFYLKAKELFQEYYNETENIIQNNDMPSIDVDEEPEPKPEPVEEETTEEEVEEKEMETIMATGEIPEFMGTDLESYGPFESGEQAEVPPENAEILVNRGNAERVE